MPPVLCSFDAIEASPIRPRRGPRARRTRAQPAALRRSHRLRVAHAPSLARTMSAATSHHATALAGARNLASSRSVRGAAIRATARVARSAPRGASLRVNAEGTTPPLFRPAPPRPRDIRRVASAPPRVTARERASRGVCHRNRPGDLADPTPRRDRADPDPPRRGRGAPPRDRATTRTPRGDPRAITDATPRVRERPPRRPLARFRPPRRRRRRALPSARPRAGRLRHVSRLRRAFPVSKAKKKKGGSRRDGRGRVELECARPDRPTRPTRSRDHPRADHLD